MDNGTLFVDTFFKPELIVRYLPDILKGMAVTVEIAVLVVAAGIALGLALALIRGLRAQLRTKREDIKAAQSQQTYAQADYDRQKDLAERTMLRWHTAHKD